MHRLFVSYNKQDFFLGAVYYEDWVVLALIKMLQYISIIS
jgi:hypothetical protein